MTKWLWDDEVGEWAEPEVVHRKRMAHAKTNFDVPVPYHVRDIEPFKSPIDGSIISSRSIQREHCIKHDVVPYEPLGNDLVPSARREFKGFKNPDFAKKRGLPLNEEGHQIKKDRERAAKERA